MKNELDVLRHLQPSGHANIANVLEVIDTKNSILAILEYCGGGSLQRCLQGRPHASGLGEEHSKHLARQLCNALAHMHGMGIAHRDVKPENVLFMDATHRSVKLCDFGFSIMCGNRRVRTICGSPQYMAPELAKKEPYHAWACDVWALGALIYEMLENRPAFRGASMEQLNIRIMRASFEAFTSATPAAARALIKGMIALEAANRFPAAEALKHQWFGGPGGLPAAQCGAITERATERASPQKAFAHQGMAAPPVMAAPVADSQPRAAPRKSLGQMEQQASPAPQSSLASVGGGFGAATLMPHGRRHEPPVQIPAAPVSSASGSFLP